MPRWGALLAVGCAALAAFLAAARARLAGSGRRNPHSHFEPLPQPEGVPKVPINRSYFFLTHHKTGTNLMSKLCNLTAQVVSGGATECAWCLRVRQGQDVSKDRLTCFPDPTPEHGKLRETVSRFSLISSINAAELKILGSFSPNFRAVHMIREPVKMAISAYMYNKFLSRPEGQRFRWDASVQDLTETEDLRDQLRMEAQAIIRPLREMAGVHDAASNDPRLLTLDLESFEKAYDATATRLFNHLFDQPPPEQLAPLLEGSALYDKSRWDARKLRQEGTTAPSQMLNKTEIQAAWRGLEEAGDPDVLAVASHAEQLGYQRPGAAAAAQPAEGR